MNEQEAINTLWGKPYIVPVKDYETAKNMAIKALEKQIPKKPIYSDFDDNGNDEIIPYKAICPICRYEFEFGKWNEEENHHCVCGQKISWSVKDE